jgi:hypothetical protein
VAIYVFNEKVFHSSQMMGFLLVLIGKLNIMGYAPLWILESHLELAKFLTTL